MSRTLRVFVIGQSPRPDVEAQILLADPVIRVRVEGALDGMSRDQIASQAPPRSGADALFTTLSAGETVTVAKAAVVARLLAKTGDWWARVVVVDHRVPRASAP
jgi:protein AroM